MCPTLEAYQGEVHTDPSVIRDIDVVKPDMRIRRGGKVSKVSKRRVSRREYQEKSGAAYIHGSVEESPSGERVRSLDRPGANTPRPWPRMEIHQGSLCVNLRWATCDQHAASQGMEGQTRTSTSRGHRIAQNRSVNRSVNGQLSEGTRSSGAATDFGVVDKIFDNLSAKPSTVPFV